MPAWTVIVLTFLLGIIYANALAAAERKHRFQGAPFTIVQVIIGLVLVLVPPTWAALAGVVRTAVEMTRLTWACAVAVGLPIAVWYVSSFDRVLEQLGKTEE